MTVFLLRFLRLLRDNVEPLSLIFQELIIQDRLQAQIKTDAQLVGETDIFQTHKATISWFVDLHGSQGGWNSSSLPRSSPWSRVGVTIGCTTKTFLISSYNFVAILIQLQFTSTWWEPYFLVFFVFLALIGIWIFEMHIKFSQNPWNLVESLVWTI